MSTAANLERLRSFHWERTSLGSMHEWPAEMQGVVAAALNSGFPIATVWGPDCIQIYNDAYNAIYGRKHPASFGAPARESWPEIWDFLGPALQQVRETGKSTWFTGMLLPLARRGMPEECYFDFSYSPVFSSDQRVIGVMSAAVDRTGEMVQRRRSPIDAWRFDLTGEDDVLSSVGAALHERLGENAMDACDAALHVYRPGGRGALVWQRRPARGLWARIACTEVPGLEPVRVAVEPPTQDHASYAHVVPVRSLDGSCLGLITLVPHVLVPPASHRRFCEQLCLRLHAALRGAQARQQEVLLLQRGFNERDQLYQILFEAMEDAVVYTAVGPGPAADEVILAANRKACELSGYGRDELVGMRREALFFAGDAVLEGAVQERGRQSSFSGELLVRRKDGRGLPVELSTRLVEVAAGQARSVCIVRDATVKQARERALADQARFDAMVELTGGIAHDFNNFLTVILGSLDALQDALPARSAERALVVNAMLGAERAAALTDQLLTYAKRQNLRTVPLRWHAFLNEIEGLLASTLGETNTLTIDADPDLPVCELDAAQLTSALLNLAANARDAMPQGGAMQLRARRAALDAPATGADGYTLPAGDYVEVLVSDTGTGIPATSLRRIFEPFFSTKPPEAGSGLGLAMVQGFVRQSGGDVRVSSTPGRGTQFRLMLPVTPAPDRVPQGEALTAAAETVLLVEDNDAVRRQTVSMLRDSGLRVQEAHDAESALQQLRRHPDIDVLLANVTLPGGLSGVELAESVRRASPRMAILLTTGGVRGALVERLSGCGFRVLRKPFSARELTQAILSELREDRHEPHSGPPGEA